jgi:two-component system alkaline phosphatase synthesis response regulator PhoP
MPYKVLVVDDEEDIVEFVSYNLQLEGYEIFRAGNGMEALNQARKHLPDLILLDLMLPDMDGFSICEILHCQPSTTNIPVIVLTALAGELPRLHGFEVGAADYCLKPVHPRDLKARVKSVLETCAAQAAESESEMDGVAVR